jgi:D-amino-acid dehydrogenase
MKVLVLGGGVIGVTSAWYLARAGHEVTLLERHASMAQETSFANGGQISWSAASPWAAPGMPTQALAWLLKPPSPLVWRPNLDETQWLWLWRMLRQCTGPRYLVNKERQLRLARYSHERLVQLRADAGITYDERTRGLLVLYRERRQLRAAEREQRLLERLGVDSRLLTADDCRAQEPALTASPVRISGGLYFPYDESGDCRGFTETLSLLAQRQGVTIETSTIVQKLVSNGETIREAITDRGPRRADSIVVACGVESARLLRPLGLHLPIYPVKGYSITVPVIADALAPQGTLTDETYKTVITRLGPNLRVAGTAEVAGYDRNIEPERIELLHRVVKDLFPQAVNLNAAEPWAGLRPMTPDNPPILGPTRYRNLYLNTGHGTLGWTMACGSAAIIADLLSDREPEIDIDGLTLARYG